MDTQTTVGKIPSWLAIVVIAGVFYLVGQYIASQPQREQQIVEANREITVRGTGEVTAMPDVARITIGVSTGTQRTAEQALTLLSERFNAVLDAVREQGISEDDIRARNVSVRPIYDFTQGRQTVNGYEASENIEITIRNLDLIGSTLAAATGEGANQVGGLQFTIDDPEELQLEAEQQAIAAAEAKAKQLADTLGARLGDVKTYSAQASGTEQPIFRSLEAVGGDGDAPAPEVPVGTQDVNVTVTVTYELR